VIKPWFISIHYLFHHRIEKGSLAAKLTIWDSYTLSRKLLVVEEELWHDKFSPNTREKRKVSQNYEMSVVIKMIKYSNIKIIYSNTVVNNAYTLCFCHL